VLAAIGIDAEVLPSAVAYRETVSFKLPATLTYFALRFVSEGGLLIVAARLMGTMSATIVTAHQITLNYAFFMFMVPLALNFATVIHVEPKLGGNDVRGARRAGFTGIGLCSGGMLVSAMVIALGNDVIAAGNPLAARVRRRRATGCECT
jgi:Na+-driven multidrug efflux pump